MFLDEDENKLKRRLGAEDDLELAIDHDEQQEDEDLKTKVIFAMQGLGGVRILNQSGKELEAYIKGPHCEDSLKDLVKFIRSDVPENPKVTLLLAHYNIVETDLIQLLLSQVEDKKLSFWLVALLAMITTKPSDELPADDRNTLFEALREYKLAFCRHDCFATLTLHIADYFKMKPQERQRAHTQMLEFIIVLIRNLLQVPDGTYQDKNLHSHFLTTFIREEMFDPLFYFLQAEKGDILYKLDITLLQIFYYTFTCFNPIIIYDLQPPKNYAKEALKLTNDRKSVPSRHSRFMPFFQHKSDRGVKCISNSMHKKDDKILTEQRQAPNRVADLKKVEKIEMNELEENFMEMEFQMVEDNTHKHKTIMEMVFRLSKEFVEVNFTILSELVFDSIYREVARVSPQNVIQYMLICSWALRMTRAKYEKESSLATTPQQKARVEFDLSQVATVMQTGHFQLIYKILYREATRPKKKEFKVNLFHGAIILFQSYIDVIMDMSISFNDRDRKNSNVLMANMFRHDIARIFKIGFHQITHEKILARLIIECHKFFKLLSTYSKGKVLTIQTNRLLKKKKKKTKANNNDNQEYNLLNQQESDNEDNEEEGVSPSQKGKRPMEEEGDDLQFQVRKFNEMSEFAIIAQYDIISKYLIFLKDDRYNTNKPELNDAIFGYFQKIVTLLKGQWLFYQAETLSVFQTILADDKFCRKNQEKAKVIRNICKDFIRLLQKNPLALVETLFRYPNLGVKELVLSNYDQQMQEQQEVEENLFTD